MAKTGRPAKDCVKVSYTLDRDVADKLKEFCEKTGRTKTRVIELAIMEFIMNHNEKNN